MWYVVERQCNSCGADMVLHGPFATKEAAEAAPRQWPGMICVDRRIVQTGEVSDGTSAPYRD